MPISVAIQLEGDEVYMRSISDTPDHSVTIEYNQRIN
jgi:hypothetical protein